MPARAARVVWSSAAEQREMSTIRSPHILPPTLARLQVDSGSHVVAHSRCCQWARSLSAQCFAQKALEGIFEAPAFLEKFADRQDLDSHV
mmetsp:Transcript_5209/g.16884  ORF Transcript_5209/g.16884 Transcript_5209/m.16884 type:complete len:90 (-) Transcript_5209:109-378(-)